MILREYRIKESAVETAIGSPKPRIVGDGASDDVIRDFKPQSRGFLIGEATVDQVFEDRVDDPHFFGLLKIDRGTKLLS